MNYLYCDRLVAEIYRPVAETMVWTRTSPAPLGNLYWKTLIEEGVTPREFDERGMIPRADSIETYLLVMKVGLNPAKAGDLRATVQYDFSGEVKGSCHLTIENGSIQAGQGFAEHPDSDHRDSVRAVDGQRRREGRWRSGADGWAVAVQGGSVSIDEDGRGLRSVGRLRPAALRSAPSDGAESAKTSGRSAAGSEVCAPRGRRARPKSAG